MAGRRHSLIVRGADPGAGRQQLDLRPGRDEPLDRVEDLHDAGAVSGNHGGADPCAAVLVEAPGLRGADLAAAMELCDDRPHERALRLERVHVSEQQVELDPSGPHTPSIAELRPSGHCVDRRQPLATAEAPVT